jgi:uncharacterized protein DUF4382
MQFSRFQLRTVFFAAALSATIGFAGCGNTCVVGFSINGNGGVIVRAGDPPPPCSLAQAKAEMTALAAKLPVCNSCAAPTRANHIYLTLRGIQIRSNISEDATSLDWVELAPQLNSEPRQFDLFDDSQPAILAKNTQFPAGIYKQVRLQFLTAPPANTETLSTLNACGVGLWNCAVSRDGGVEPLNFPAGAPEFLTLLQGAQSDSLLVIPDARLELRLFLELRQWPQFVPGEGWKNQNVLAGHAKVVPQDPVPFQTFSATQSF